MKWQLNALEFRSYDWANRDIPSAGSPVLVLSNDEWETARILENGDVNGLNMAISEGSKIIGSGFIVEIFNDGEETNHTLHIVAWRDYVSHPIVRDKKIS